MHGAYSKEHVFVQRVALRRNTIRALQFAHEMRETEAPDSVAELLNAGWSQDPEQRVGCQELILKIDAIFGLLG